MGIGRRFNLVRVDNLKIKDMTRPATGAQGTRPRCPAGGRPEPWDPGFGVGSAGASAAVRCLQFRRPRGREGGHRHHDRARPDCAWGLSGSRAGEPQTSPSAPIGVVAGIPRLQTGRMSRTYLHLAVIAQDEPMGLGHSRRRGYFHSMADDRRLSAAPLELTREAAKWSTRSHCRRGCSPPRST